VRIQKFPSGLLSLRLPPSMLDTELMDVSEEQVHLVALLHRFFAAVSFSEGSAPRYEELAELFATDGRLIRTGSEVPQNLRVDDFIADRRGVLADGALTSFHESEIAGRTDVFGHVAHRLSTYRKNGVLKGSSFEARGVISTQFVKDHHGWKISSMAWDDERPGLTIPAG
jgi:hypothetical protein